MRGEEPDALLEEFKRAYKHHSAFQSELRRAITESGMM